MKGQLITFSGIDGSGKTTQINLLYNYLVRLGKDPIILKQPTDWYLQHPTVRMRIDNNDQNTDLHFLALFSAADRCYQQSIDIAPRLSEGLTVIMDRYVYSAYAYFSARGLHDHCWLETINKFSLEPDLALYLDIGAG
jgi:dTMP kinase